MTAETTPPSLRRPEAVGWAPLVCAGPLTTSLLGLWVSGLLPPGNGGTNEGAATLKPTKRPRGLTHNSRAGIPKRTATLTAARTRYSQRGWHQSRLPTALTSCGSNRKTTHPEEVAASAGFLGSFKKFRGSLTS